MLQKRPDGDTGDRHLQCEQERHKPLLCPAVQDDSQREHSRKARMRIGRQGVFLKRDEKVFVIVVPDCSRKLLVSAIKELIFECSTIYTNGWKVYDGLMLNGYEHYCGKL